MTARKNTSKADTRLTHSAAQAQRDARSTADSVRVEPLEAPQNLEARIAALRDSEIEEILPTPPDIPGWHVCWLSTTNSSDSIFKRVRQGWVPVMAADVPGFDDYVRTDGGTYDGIVACNEMLLYKLPKDEHHARMVYYHHVKPNEEEASIRAKLPQGVELTSRQQLGVDAENEGFQELAANKNPVFNC